MTINMISFMVLAILACIQHGAVARPPLGIVNGTTADDGEFPYMVQLRNINGYLTCGGSIIGAEWILTSGYCVAGGKIASIVYGTNKLYDYLDGYPDTSINVTNWFQHPKFHRISPLVPLYDVGLLQLAEPIPFSDRANVLRLADSNATVPFHTQGILAGWGVNTTYGVSPPYLQKINRTLLTDEECTEKINSYAGVKSFISTYHLCSDDYYDGECSGDSGGPLVINGYQYAIASWRYNPCGIVPGAYSRLTNPEFRDWILKVTNI